MSKSIETAAVHSNKNNEVSGRFDVALVHFQNTKEYTTIEGNILNQQSTSTFH